MENPIQESMETMEMPFRQFYFQERKELAFFFFFLIFAVLYCSTFCWIIQPASFSHVNTFFLRNLILYFSEHLTHLKPICHNNLFSLCENTGELKFLLKKLVFWTWLVRIVAQPWFTSIIACKGQVVPEWGNCTQGKGLWLSGKYMFIYGWQPLLSSDQ